MQEATACRRQQHAGGNNMQEVTACRRQQHARGNSMQESATESASMWAGTCACTASTAFYV
eukprot:264010-Chlamydomonas_euryale.AAC.2